MLHAREPLSDGDLPVHSAPDLGTAADALERELALLPSLPLDQLRTRWRQRLRSAPPPQLSRALLLRLLAYKLQARHYGDLDPDTARLLARVARERTRRKQKAEAAPAPAAPAPVPALTSSGLRPGTLLVREFAGQLHTVTVTPEGFCWNEQRFTSLSEVARAITGTRWNGPRFFGLRDKSRGGQA